MFRSSNLQGSHLDLTPLIHSVTGGICFLFALSILGQGIQDTSLRDLQQNSIDFFVRCNTNNCTSLIIPFIAYILNVGENLEKLFIMWLAINTGLYIYLLFQLTQSLFTSRFLIAIASIPLVVLALNTPNPTPLTTAMPCTFSLLLASLLHAQGKKSWVYFVFLATLFNLPMGFLTFASLICYLMSTREDKQARRDMVKIIHSITLALAIITLYLLLIEYNVLGWLNIYDHREKLSRMALSVVSLAFSYLTINLAMISIYAKKNT